MSFVQQLIGWVSGAITNALNEFWNWITSTLASIFDKVKEVLSGMVKWVWENAAAAFNTIVVQPLTSGLKAAAAYVMQKLKGTLYIAIVVPLMLREVRGIIEWRTPSDIGIGIAKLLLKPVIARLGVELFWALLPSVLPTPSVLQPPTVQPVPPAPPAFTAPPPAARTAQAAWTDAVEAAAAAAIVAGVVQELRDSVAASAAGAVVGPATASLSDVVRATSAGSVAGPTTLSLADSVSAASAGSVAGPATVSLADSVASSSAGSAGPLYATVNLSDSVASSSTLGSSSGIDPFMPLWFYRYYDKTIRRQFWDFFASDEIGSFFTSTAKPSWADNYALFDTVTAYRDVYAAAYAIAVCVKPVIAAISQETELLYVAIDNGVSALRGAVLKAVNAQTLRLYDRGGLNYTEFPWNGDWIVIYFPFESKYAYVYDRNGNLLAARALDDYLSGGTPRHVITGSSPSTSIRLMIDWVTVSVP